jgi:hypothetical protein
VDKIELNYFHIVFIFLNTNITIKELSLPTAVSVLREVKCCKKALQGETVSANECYFLHIF